MRDYLIARFEQAAELLPEEVRQAAGLLTEADKAAAEEFRLRIGRAFTVLLPGGERELGESGTGREGKPVIVTKSGLLRVLDISTNSSIHTSIESIKSGFVTAHGGHRVGICGTAVVRDGEIVNIKNISSLSVRISKELKGISDPLAESIMRDGIFESTLLISPPGMGKTTLLRDIVRRLGAYFRVSLADERGEIAALHDGIPQLDIGSCTDVMENCPKALAIMLLLRSMSPQIIAADEITAPEDIKAMEQAANCGVKLLATAHAYSADDLYSRPLYRGLLDLKLFKKLVTIRIENGQRFYGVTDLR